MREFRMNSEYGGDLITISDDDGNDYVLEHLDTIEVNDVFYMAFLPTDISEEDEDYGIVILKVTEENGEEILSSVDDDDLLEEIYERFSERFAEEDEDLDENDFN